MDRLPYRRFTRPSPRDPHGATPGRGGPRSPTDAPRRPRHVASRGASDRSRRRAIAVAIGSCALLAAAAPAAIPPDGELVVVLYRDTPCLPEAHALVTVEPTGRVARSDSLGIAVFTGLPVGEYHVRIEPGARGARPPVERTVRVDRGTRSVLAIDVGGDSRRPDPEDANPDARRSGVGLAAGLGPRPDLDGTPSIDDARAEVDDERRGGRCARSACGVRPRHPVGSPPPAARPWGRPASTARFGRNRREAASCRIDYLEAARTADLTQSVQGSRRFHGRGAAPRAPGPWRETIHTGLVQGDDHFGRVAP